MTGDCEICGTEIEIQMCCSGRECGCMGKPVNPPVCSSYCYDKYTKKRKVNLNNKDSHFYRKLEEITPEIEGEIIQDIYLFFKKFELSEEKCDVDDGVLVPTLDDIWDMQKGLEKIFKDRHEVFIKEGLYNKNWIKEKK